MLLYVMKQKIRDEQQTRKASQVFVPIQYITL